MYKKYQKSFVMESNSAISEGSIISTCGKITTLGFPTLPDAYSHLRIEETCQMDPCDCIAKPCPHNQDVDFNLFVKYLPGRLRMLEKSGDTKSVHQLYEKVKLRLSSHKCNLVSSSKDPYQVCYVNLDGSYNTDSTSLESILDAEEVHHKQCHYCKGIDELFGFTSQFPTDIPVTKKRKISFGSLVINLSFIANIILLILKIVAYIISNSMSVMASMVDSALDILSGFVLYIAIRMAKKGVEQGKYQEYIHTQDTAKILYSSRYESLGVLAFSCFMSMLSLILVKDAVCVIIDIAKGHPPTVDFSAAPIAIMCITIILKLVLCLMAQFAQKMSRNQRDAIIAYRDDHRNDVITNIVSLAGMWISSIGGNWQYVDPVISGLLCSFIFLNWTRSGIEQMKSMVGCVIKNEDVECYYVKLLTSFICASRIEQVQHILAYQQGQAVNLEISVQIPDDMAVCESHEIAQVIQNDFELMDGVERCFVHLESKKCHHNFTTEDEIKPLEV
ncbi:Cation efflux family protein [Spironucleus salmonicida]|uniref:Cation efflux family protein n=1 Tax=Spironucleus salmonicida TaxID=348837 RepID=V6LZX4_9EUKA|nr:Cation efflux family protein [Spironucleus salmonicida]|eukprot:EST46409.1 Cation efflux family protein [Spironucleus salmonicida]